MEGGEEERGDKNATDHPPPPSPPHLAACPTVPGTPPPPPPTSPSSCAPWLCATLSSPAALVGQGMGLPPSPPPLPPPPACAIKPPPPMKSPWWGAPPTWASPCYTAACPRRRFGRRWGGGGGDSATTSTPHDLPHFVDATYDVLAVLEFTSARRSQSVVVRRQGGGGDVELFCKVREKKVLYLTLTTQPLNYPPLTHHHPSPPRSPIGRRLHAGPPAGGGRRDTLASDCGSPGGVWRGGPAHAVRRAPVTVRKGGEGTPAFDQHTRIPLTLPPPPPSSSRPPSTPNGPPASPPHAPRSTGATRRWMRPPPSWSAS